MAASPVMSDEQRLVDQFLELVHIDSPPLHERRIMERLAPELAAMGCRVEFDQAGEIAHGEVGNLIATLPANREGLPAIFLSAHVDTVAPTAGIKTIVENGIVRTDGTTILGADDKAAVTAILEAVRHVAANDLPHGDIQVLFSICEEAGLKGALAMDLSLVHARLGFVFDSSQPVSGLVVNAPSHDKLVATVHGRKAHAGAAPEDGISAIQAAAAGIARMKLLRIDPETTANIGIIQGGEATNVVPDRVEIVAEARSRNEASLKRQIEHMASCLREGAAEYGATVDIEVSRHYTTFELSKDEPVVGIASRAVERLGLKPQLLPTGGGSDASIFNQRGLPSVVLGLGYKAIHTHNEHIAVADLVNTYRLAVAVIQEVAEMGAAVA